MNRNAAAQAQQAPQDVLAGIVERVTLHNAENGFCVLRVKALRTLRPPVRPRKSLSATFPLLNYLSSTVTGTQSR